MMKRAVGIVSVSLCAALAAGPAWAAAVKFKSEDEKRSYAIGANMVKQMKERGLKVDADAMARGVKDEAKGKPALDAKEVGSILQKLRDEAQKKALEEYEKSAKENLERGEKYTQDFAKQEGVKTLAGGVLYKVLVPGTGEKPTEDSTVLCNYTGKLVGGKVFDQTEPGKPATLKIDQLISGWINALVEMPVGSKWEIVIPPQKAYGKTGNNRSIGPNETLIFELELLEIK